jgi:hypothetical protein
MVPTNGDKSNELHALLAGMGLVCLVIMMLIVGVMHLADEMGPRIGDIISFDPARTRSIDTATKITVFPAGASASCVLDLQVMWTFGGSLVIAATQLGPNPSFRAHWAGTRTSDGATNCGASADLQLNQADIVALKLAARNYR